MPAPRKKTSKKSARRGGGEESPKGSSRKSARGGSSGSGSASGKRSSRRKVEEEAPAPSRGSGRKSSRKSSRKEEAPAASGRKSGRKSSRKEESAASSGRGGRSGRQSGRGGGGGSKKGGNPMLIYGGAGATALIIIILIAASSSSNGENTPKVKTEPNAPVVAQKPAVTEFPEDEKWKQLIQEPIPDNPHSGYGGRMMQKIRHITAYSQNLELKERNDCLHYIIKVCDAALHSDTMSDEWKGSFNKEKHTAKKLLTLE